MHKVFLLIPFLTGCACLQDKPALRTALIATGSAILAGSVSHARASDPAPTVHLTDPDCKHKDCR